MKDNEYICYLCEQTYEKITPDEECWKEVEELMPEAIHDEMSIICDDCFLDFMKWFEKLTPQQKKKMRDDHIKESYN